MDAFEKAGAKIIYQEIDGATNADPNAGTATFVGLMGANPDVKIAVTDHGGLTSNVGVYARAAGLKPGDVFLLDLTCPQIRQNQSNQVTKI